VGWRLQMRGQRHGIVENFFWIYDEITRSMWAMLFVSVLTSLKAFGDSFPEAN
jgi:hypothetical protein